MEKFRETTPVRTCTKKYKSHRSYKKYLELDFNKKCGYCDDHDSWAGGRREYQIDHFVPLSKFTNLPNLKTDYKNLVYSCFYCNNAKSDKWISTSHEISVIRDKGFIDPCSNQYEEHLCRDQDGNISYLTKLGKYIFDNLDLGLLRHSIIWKLEKIHKQLDEVEKLLAVPSINTSHINDLLEKQNQLINDFRKYYSHFRKIIDD